TLLAAGEPIALAGLSHSALASPGPDPRFAALGRLPIGRHPQKAFPFPHRAFAEPVRRDPVEPPSPIWSAAAWPRAVSRSFHVSSRRHSLLQPTDLPAASRAQRLFASERSPRAPKRSLKRRLQRTA